MVKGGVKVSKSIGLVMEISEIYVDNYQKMLSDENDTPEELAAISSGYTMLIDESSYVLQDLKNVVNVTGMSLTDAERLAIIDNAYRSLMNYRNLTIKVVKIDKATMDYYIRLTEFHRQFQTVGNNYNQVVRAIGAISGRNVRCHYFTNWRK